MQYIVYSPVHVLYASAHEHDRRVLENIFSHSRWEIEMAQSLSDLERKFSERVLPVVMCDCTLPDATWRDVYRRLNRLAKQPLLVVTCGQPDDNLWAEVLNIGAYDVLAKPFHPPEVYRVVSLAWRHSVDNWKRGLPAEAESETPTEAAAKAAG